MYSRNTFCEISNFRDPIHKSKFSRHTKIYSPKVLLIQQMARAHTFKIIENVNLIFAFSTHYFYMICCNNVFEKRLSHYMIKSTLNWSDLMFVGKKLGRQRQSIKTIALSQLFSLLKIKSKANIFENIFKIPWNM